MNIAINTDFLGSNGSPEPRLRAIAEAGFTHLHWCHQWCTDFLYSSSELKAIAGWLRETGLKLLDIHSSAGVEKCWFSPVEYERQAGVELVRNRIEMLGELGGTGAIMMHIPCIQPYMNTDRNLYRQRMDALKRSIDELLVSLEHNHTCLAVENMWGDNWESIDELLAAYPPERLGICYDSGHGNSQQLKQLDFLEQRKNRIQALHLNDNDGTGDQHQPPFMGTVDWDHAAGILATSSYDRELSFELAMRCTPFYDKTAEPITNQTPENIQKFLHDAHERCVRFATMVEKKRQDI